MRDQGVYVQLWRKYIPVIRLLLKKTLAGTDQKLLLYKHEFEKTGAKNKLGYIFSLEVVNGKPINKSDKTAVAADLLTVINETEGVASMLKEQSVKFSVGRSCEMSLQKVAVVEKVAAVVAESVS